MVLTGSMRISRKMKDAGNWMITTYASNSHPWFPTILILTYKKRMLLFCFPLRRRGFPLYCICHMDRQKEPTMQDIVIKTSWQNHTGVRVHSVTLTVSAAIAWTPLWSCMKLNFLSQLARTYSWFVGAGGIRKKNKSKGTKPPAASTFHAKRIIHLATLNAENEITV